jgi:putative PIN family toxin of toxin-antitoxin system
VRVVVDTNVLVSGLLNASGPPGRVVDGVMLGELVPVVDDRLLSEYREVLARPKFRFDLVQRERVLEFVERVSERVVAPPLGADLPDLDDLPFLEVAACGAVEALVTGNIRHFPPEQRFGVRVLSPAELVVRWAERRAGGSGRPPAR